MDLGGVPCETAIGAPHVSLGSLGVSRTWGVVWAGRGSPGDPPVSQPWIRARGRGRSGQSRGSQRLAWRRPSRGRHSRS
ncbi:hypothetical protein Nmel_015977 [Mimus melanotis]